MSQQTDASTVNQPLMQGEEYKGSPYRINVSSEDANHACSIGWDFLDLWGKKCELDITIIVLDEYSLEMDVAHYNQPNILNNAVSHSRRNILDNKDDDDIKHDKKIEINLKKLPPNCRSLWFLVNGKFENVESANFNLYNNNNDQLHSYSALLSGYNPTAMLLGVLWRDQNGIDWNYDKIEEHGDGINYKESKKILYSNLRIVYSVNTIKKRPNDRTKQYELGGKESYVIDPSINKVTLGLGWDDWDPAECGTIDVDGSVIVFHTINNQLKLEGIVSGKYNLWYSDSIKHHGDDQKFDMFLNKMYSDKIDIVCVLINIASGATSFRSIKNCFARLIDDENNELCKVKLSDNYDTCGLVLCTINKQTNGCWCLNTIGEGIGGRNAKNSVESAKKICMGQNLTDNDKQTDDCCCIIL